MSELADLSVNVVRLAPDDAMTRLLQHALQLGCSDLFLHTDEQNVSAAVRHLGTMRSISTLPADLGRRVIAQLKARAGMDIAEKRRPLDGRWMFQVDDKQKHVVDLRVNILPTLYGEDVSIRLLERGARLFVMENLGMTPEQLKAYTAMSDSPSGLILLTGPTGSGKTATLYASLIRLNNGLRKICTIEDPVEFAIDGLRQAQINPAIDLGFAELLKGVLRQSPDIIMVGEIRDPETAQTAVRAANSGHLVFATLHAPTAAGAVQSIRALGVHNHFLASALRGCVSQRLVRTLCPTCKISFDLSMAPHTFDEVRPWLGADEGKKLYAPKGCPDCRMLGYAGRTAVFEVMAISRDIRNLVSDGAPTRDIRDRARAEKMLDFKQAALLQVARGATSTEEIFRAIPTEHLVDQD